MAADKIKPRYIFVNPNSPNEVERILRRIIIEKLQSSYMATVHNAN